MPAVQVVERRVQVDPLGLGQGRDHPGEQRVRVDARPDGHGPVAEAPPGVGNEDRRVGPVLRAQALADRAPAERAVEREVVRRELFEAAAAAVARAVLAVAVHMPVRLVRLVADPRDVEHPLAQVERRLDRVGQARPASTGGRSPDRPRPRSGACGGGSAWAGCPGRPTCRRRGPGRSPRRGARPRAPRTSRRRAAPPGAMT